MTQPGKVDAFGHPVEPPPPPSPPQLLLIARWLWIGSALVGAIRSFVQLADREALVSRLRDLEQGMSQEELDTAANGEVMFTLLLSALILGCYLLFSTRMLQGHNWARIVLAVFGGLSAVGTVLTLSMVAVMGTGLIRELTGASLGVTELLFGGITLLMGVAALVLMFHRDANRFFRKVRPQRR